MPTITLSSGIIDTMLQQANPTTGFGTAKSIGVDTGGSAEVQALLAFPNLFGTGPGQIPLGATITSATLTLNTTNPSNQGGSIYRMLSGWNANSTWNSFGGDGIQFNGVEAASAADVITGATATGSRGFTVTDSVKAWSAGAANNGWVIKAGGTDGWDFYSSEGSIKPTLTVEYTTEAVPPPGPTVSIQAGTPNPQTEGTGAKITFNLNLDQVQTHDVVVNYSTQDGSATSGDYFGVSNGSVTIRAGQTSAAIEITLKDDNLAEGTEAFTVKINSVSGAGVGTATATGTIRDNDSPSPPPPIQASVVKVHDSTPYGAGDPSGLAYSPGLNLLFIADSEHDESPYFSSTNLFAIRPDGTFVKSYSLTGFTKEPTGIAYNPANGYLYVTDDDKQKVFWFEPSDGPIVPKGEFSTTAFGGDSEDPKFDPVTGHMYMLDGVARKMFELTPTGGLVRTINLPTEMRDAEALAYDPAHNVFFVASGVSSKIYEMDRNGNLLATLDIFADYRNPANGFKPSIKGLELAPSSNPNDGDKMSLYVADYGADQKLDGRIFEVDLGSGWLVT